MVSRVLGLARDVVVAAVFPAASLDAFLVAFRFPNMLRDIVGEGASNAAFVPVLSETLEKEGDSAFQELTSALMSAMFVILGVITVLGVLFMPLVFHLQEVLKQFAGERAVDRDLALMISLTRWTFPYILFIGLAVFQMGPLFILKDYATPSWSPALLNVFVILCSWRCFRDVFPDPAYALVAGVWLGGVSQFLVQYVALGRRAGTWRPNFRLRHPGVRAALWLLAPVIIGQAAGEVNKVVDTLFAASLQEGAVTALSYANRLIQLPLSVFGIAISAAVLPAISRAVVRDNLEEVRETLMHGFRQVLFLMAPAVAVLTVAPRPIVALLFERGEFSASLAERTAGALAYYAAGLLCFAWVKVAVAGFYAVKDTRTPVLLASGSMVLNIILNFALVGPMGYKGLALATTVSYSINFLLLYVFLGWRFGRLWDRAWLRGMGAVLLATAACAGALAVAVRVAFVLAPQAGLAAKLVRVAGPLAAAGAVYVLACLLLGVSELGMFASAFRRAR